MPDVVHELLIDHAAAEKLGRRVITGAEAQQLLDNWYLVLRNPHRASKPPTRFGLRRLMIGKTNGGRHLTLVIQRTIDPTDWQVVTGWDSANHERRMLRR